MAQHGTVFESHGSWYVRWWEKVQQDDGSLKWAHPSHRLASKRDYPKKSEVTPLANEFMERVNRSAKSPNAGITIVEFFENVWREVGSLNRQGVQRLVAVPHSGSSVGPGEGFQDGGWR